MSSNATEQLRVPESVLVIVYSDDAEVLLLKRTAPFPFWQSITGSLEENESAAGAAERELFEETGLRADDTLKDAKRSRTFRIDPRWRNRYAPDVTDNLEYEWHYRLPAPIGVRLDDSEHSAFQWVPIDAAIEIVWSWTNKEALQTLRTELRSKL